MLATMNRNVSQRRLACRCRCFFDGLTWEVRNPFPVELVGDANFDFIQHVQNVEFCQSNAATVRLLLYWAAQTRVRVCVDVSN